MRKIIVLLILGVTCLKPQGATYHVALKEIAWNPTTRAFTWESRVTSTAVQDAPFVKYQIDFTKRSMTTGSETRYFTKEEAQKMQLVLDQVVSDYAAVSTVWWAKGEGTTTPEPDPSPPKKEEKKVAAR